MPDTETTNLSLGFSPCPNDTFIFDAIVHGRIDTEGLAFDISMEDVETLNKAVVDGLPDISKVSFAAYAQASDFYQILDAGSALGRGAGPLLVCKPGSRGSGGPEEFSRLKNISVAIPGRLTTAHFLFQMFFPGVVNRKEMIFSAIEDAVLSGKADAGVIIHEGRFTYEQKGLVKVADLGEMWEQQTGRPVPLGGIAVRRSLPELVKEKIERVVRRSIGYAFAFPQASGPYVRQHARELSEEVIRKHIQLYVNDFSKSLGEEGRDAVNSFLRKAVEMGLVKSLPGRIFACDAASATKDLHSLSGNI